VWQHWCIPDEKRLFGITATINEVEDRLHGFSSNRQALVTVT
jgi:hypothetical protein